MDNNTFNISDLYIGKVVKVYKDTHELEVYLPKLMPTLNYGFSDTVYSVDLQSRVIKSNNIICQPDDFKERVPEVGSITKVFFIDGDIKKVYWMDFDPFGTNTYVEFEKVGYEKTLEDFAKLFDVRSSSVLPKDVGFTLGSESKPFAEIFGNINVEYVSGLDERLKKLSDDISKNMTLDLSSINLKTLKEIKVINTARDKTPLTVDGIAGTTSKIATFGTNGDITSSIDPDGNINVKSVTINDAPGPISWNSVSDTMEIPMGNGVMQQVGENIYYPKVINKTGIYIPKGTPVRYDGMFGEYIMVAPMIADNSVDRFQYMGLAAHSMEPEQTGRVTYFGKVVDIDTSQFAVNSVLYISTTEPGELTDVKPIAPHNAIPVGMVMRSDSVNGLINVRYNYMPKASEVTYDNSESDLSSTNLQSAVDELNASKASIASLSANITLYPTGADSDITGYKRMVRTTLDVDYNEATVDITTPTISTNDQLIASLVSDNGVIVGNPGVVNVTTLGNIKKLSGDSQQYGEFFFRIYLRNQMGIETLVSTSNTTGPINPYDSNYYPFNATAILNNGEWTETDRMVIKYYANTIGNEGSIYALQFGGNTPVRTLIPVPAEVIPSSVAGDILVDTTNFNRILSASDANIQSAFDTIDDHNHDNDYVKKLNDTATELNIINSSVSDSPLVVDAIQNTTADIQSWKINGTTLAGVTHEGNFFGKGSILDNIRIGISGTNEIDTSSGDLILDSESGLTIVDDNLDVKGNIVIEGNLTVQGTNTILDTTTLTTADDMIVLRSAATQGTPMTSYSGLVTKYYNGVNSGALVYDNLGILRIGDVTLNLDGSITDVSMQKVATREEHTTLNSVPYWSDNGDGKLNSSSILINPITGNVGIGIAPDTYKLKVDGTGMFTGSLAATSFQDSSDGTYYLDPANTGTSLNVAGDAKLGNRLFSKTLYLGEDTDASYITSIIGSNTTSIKLQTKNNQSISLNSGTGGVGIGVDVPSAMLDVVSTVPSKVTLITNSPATQTASLQEWRVNGNPVSWIDNDGGMRVSEIRNKSTTNNSKVTLGSSGTVITRNSSDENSVLVVNQLEGSSTGAIQEWQATGARKAYVDMSGSIAAPNLRNMSSADNSLVAMNEDGSTISRNVADANASLKVKSLHADSTGNIQEWLSNIDGSTIVRARVDKTGSFYTNNLVVAGNLTVEGTNTVLNTTTVTTEDDIIVLRSSGQSGVPMASYAGLVAKLYNGTNSGALVFDNTGTAWVGDSTILPDGSIVDVSMQPIATRDIAANLTNNNLVKWDAVNSRLVDAGSSLGNVNNAEITISGGTDLETGGSFTLNQTDNQTITLDHSNVTRTNTTGTAVTILPDSGSQSFTVITGVSSSATGHITGTESTTISVPTPENSTITLTAGNGLITGGDFTLNQDTDKEIIFNLGTPSTLSSTSTNDATADSHTHAITSGTLNGTSNVITVTGTGKVLDSNLTINLVSGFGDTINPYASKAANTFLASPNGTNGDPSFRSLVNADLPDSDSVADDIIAYNVDNEPDIAEMTYTAVSVNSKGIVTAGAYVLEVGAPGQTAPSAELIYGGLFFKDVTA